MIGDRVVIDGNAALTLPIDGACDLNIILDGTCGEYMRVPPEDVDVYTGRTEVDPDFIGVVLPTKEKYVAKNITVNPIQVESVSNVGGGRTVYIGGII